MVRAKEISAVIVEPYRSEYMDMIGEMIVHIQSQEFGIPLTLADQPDLKMIPTVYQKNRGNFWMARDGNKLIGTIALVDVGNNDGVIKKMFVRKENRGSGVSQQLLDVLLAWANTQGFQHLYLGTNEKFTAAMRFYEKNGFMEIAAHVPGEHVQRVRFSAETRFYHRRLP